MEFPLFLIDVREACREKRDGKGQWTYGFVQELLSRPVAVELLTDAIVPSEWDAHAKRIDAKNFGWHWQVARYLRSKKNILYVSPTSYIVPFLLGGSVPYVPVVHDLIAFRGEPHNAKATWIEKFTLKSAVRSAAHVLTVSESTRADLLQKYPALDARHVTSVFAGPMHNTIAMNAPDGKTILCIATLSPRKNQERLILAYQSLPPELRSQYRLVLVGNRGWDDERILHLANTTPGVEWRGYASAEEYDRLLQTCTIFALPSLYEGFGMQILDALQCGVPVLTSDRGSLKEVTGNASVTVDPESISSIAAGLEQLMRDENLRLSLRQKGPAQAAQFSWKRTVDLFLGILSSHAEVSPGRPYGKI